MHCCSRCDLDRDRRLRLAWWGGQYCRSCFWDLLAILVHTSDKQMKPDISGQDFSCWASRWNPKMYILRKIFMINSILTGPQGWVDGQTTDSSKITMNVLAAVLWVKGWLSGAWRLLIKQMEKWIIGAIGRTPEADYTLSPSEWRRSSAWSCGRGCYCSVGTLHKETAAAHPAQCWRWRWSPDLCTSPGAAPWSQHPPIAYNSTTSLFSC